MIAPALAPTPDPALHALVARLGKRHFAESPLSIGDNGAVIAQFFRSRITSGFQPVVRAADGAVTGHHALLRVQSPTGESVAPWSLFAQASNDPALVKLDRLCRTVHALNYLPFAGSGAKLHVNVERRLLSGVSADHGAYYEAILALLGIPTHRVVIVMPADAVENPVVFVRAAISYRSRGYRVMVPVRSIADAELSHVFLAAPHFVSIDDPSALAGAAARRFLDAAAANGIELLARGIENEQQARAARAAGVGLLQGFHVGRP